MELKDVKKVEAPRLYTAKEVMEFMKLSYIQVYRLVLSGKLKTVNIAPEGSKKAIYGFKPEDIQSYYDSVPHTINRTKAVHK